MRVDECCSSFDRFDAVSHWGCSDVNYVALAQHYGLRTMMVDITSDLRTALFFACCKMDRDGKWIPLTNQDFCHRASRKTELGLGPLGDSKYGILFRAPRELIDIRLLVEAEEEKTILPVGYQPFMRCAAQSAYMFLATDPHYDMYQDTRFEKYRFRLTEEICRWIYDEMQQGKMIYPYEDIPDIYREISEVNRTVVFSEPVYNKMCDGINKTDMAEEEKRLFLHYLSDQGVTSSPGKAVFSEERIKEINKKYTPEYAEKLIKTTTWMRPMMHLNSDFAVEDNQEENTLK